MVYRYMDDGHVAAALEIDSISYLRPEEVEGCLVGGSVRTVCDEARSVGLLAGL